MIKTIIAFVTLFGMATVYTTDQYDGKVLYCDTPETDLTYRDDLAFVALPVNSDWQCFDWIVIRFENGETLHAQAMDAGPFDDLYIEQPDGELLPILVDVPEHLWSQKGISAKATVINLSRLNRLLPDDMMVGYLRE